MAVKVYSTPTCKWCNVLKEHLNVHHINYVDMDVSKDRNAALEMIKKSGQCAVPVVEINGCIIIGYDGEAIDRLLSA